MGLDHIGYKIKQLRLKHKKTQQQIADECGISKSLLSKIENGQTSSAIATLSKIAKVLDVSLSWLLETAPEKDLVLIYNKDRKRTIGDQHMGYSYELLANRSPYIGIESTIVYVTPKDENLRDETYTHSQDEFIFILEGKIELYYDNQTYPMGQGDSAHFSGRKSHLFIPVDNQGAKVLTLFIENNTMED